MDTSAEELEKLTFELNVWLINWSPKAAAGLLVKVIIQPVRNMFPGAYHSDKDYILVKLYLKTHSTKHINFVTAVWVKRRIVSILCRLVLFLT